MRRRLRLAGPAIAFAAVGAALLVLGTNTDMRLKGGFATSGAYALALQLVLASFLLAAIDDLQEPPQPRERPARHHLLATGEVVAADIRRALTQFYLSSPLAALLLHGVGKVAVSGG